MKAQDFFNDANHRFNCAFAQTVDFTAYLRLKLVGHFDCGRGVGGWRLWRLSKESLPTLLMRLPTRRDVGFNATLSAGDYVGGLKKPLSIAAASIGPRCSGMAARVGSASALSLG